MSFSGEKKERNVPSSGIPLPRITKYPHNPRSTLSTGSLPYRAKNCSITGTKMLLLILMGACTCDGSIENVQLRSITSSVSKHSGSTVLREEHS